ncbi:SIR2 family protein [Bacillus sp. ILBB4]|nr:SIR2 family protein [Bacillus sp. ILBB4]
MQMSTLDKLIKQNEFPIVFIGSGISKRYLEDYPNWEGLLREFWSLTQEDSSFYAYLNRLRSSVETQQNQLSKSEINFLTNVKMGSTLEKKINHLFFEEKYHIKNLDQEVAYHQSISPFKKALANKFSTYELKENISEEFEQFKKMLIKAQIILTTNYDTLIEDAYNKISKYGVKTYIGQKGFFQQTVGYAELYKLHGCASDPNSIIIGEDDYHKFDENSVLISAKIISLLLNSPIIFLGYSLTDRNVRKIIKDFSSSLSEDERLKMEERLIVVERHEGMDSIVEERINDSELNCCFTLLKTDNFMSVYRKISQINQGVAPSEVRKYQHVIRDLIVDRGKEGSLNSLLIAPNQLDNLEEVVENRNLIVALGDSTTIFAMPDLITYVHNYIFEGDELSTSTILRFIATQHPTSRLPFVKHVSYDSIEKSDLYPSEKEKLKNRLEKYGDYKSQKETIANSYRIEATTIEEIKSMDFTQEKIYAVIAYNMDVIDLSSVEEYIKGQVAELKENGELTISTELRRLMLIYDLKKNKKQEVSTL